MFGISPHGEASHAKFKAKYGLPFPLLADTDHSVSEAYEVWGEKTNYGKTSMGIRRSTFLIDRDGTVRKVWKKVDVKEHDQQVIDALDALS